MNTFEKISTVVTLGVLTLGAAVANAQAHERRTFLPQIGAATSHVVSLTADIGSLSVELGTIVGQVGKVTAEIGATIGEELTREFQKRARAPRIVTSRASTPSVTVTELTDSVVVVATRLPAEPTDAQHGIRVARAAN